MAWQTPKTNWASADVPAPSDFNRIEGNTAQLRTDLDAHAAATTGVHGATSGLQPNRIMMRDSAGRAKVGAPSAPDDIARLAEVNTRARIITGTYTGNNASSRFINVGAPPVFVMVVGEVVHFGAADVTWMFDPADPVLSYGDPTVGPLISGNGFEVGYVNSPYNRFPPNRSGVTYNWIAFIK